MINLLRIKSYIFRFYKSFKSFPKNEILTILRYSLSGTIISFFALTLAFVLRINTYFQDNIIYTISTSIAFCLSLFMNLLFTFKTSISKKNIFKYTICFLIALLISSSISKFLEAKGLNFAANQILSMVFYSISMYTFLRVSIQR